MPPNYHEKIAKSLKLSVKRRFEVKQLPLNRDLHKIIERTIGKIDKNGRRNDLFYDKRKQENTPTELAELEVEIKKFREEQTNEHLLEVVYEIADFYYQIAKLKVYSNIYSEQKEYLETIKYMEGVCKMYENELTNIYDVDMLLISKLIRAKYIFRARNKEGKNKEKEYEIGMRIISQFTS